MGASNLVWLSESCWQRACLQPWRGLSGVWQVQQGGDALGMLAGGRSSSRRLGCAVQAPLQAHHGARVQPAHLAAGVRHQHRRLLLLGCESPSPSSPPFAHSCHHCPVMWEPASCSPQWTVAVCLYIVFEGEGDACCKQRTYPLHATCSVPEQQVDWRSGSPLFALQPRPVLKSNCKHSAST